MRRPLQVACPARREGGGRPSPFRAARIGIGRDRWLRAFAWVARCAGVPWPQGFDGGGTTPRTTRGLRLKVAALLLIGCLCVESRLRIAYGDDAPRGSARAEFAIWSPSGGNTGDLDRLRQLLAGSEVAQVRVCSSFADLLASDAQVLIIRGDNRTGEVSSRDVPPSSVLIEKLKGRRVVGIGYEGRLYFKALGLEVGDSVTIDAGALKVRFGGEDGIRQAEISVYGAAPPDVDVPSESGSLYLPHVSQLGKWVTIVAAWAVDPRYALATRQQNYLWCGVAGDVRAWTTEFSHSFQAECMALARSAHVEFALPEWPVATSGTSKVILDPVQARNGICERRYYLKSESPFLLSVEVHVAGGGSVELELWAERSSKDNDKQDEVDGAIFMILPIPTKSIAANTGRYWVLCLRNLADSVRAECSLRIEYGVSRVIRVSSDVTVDMDSPMADPGVTRRLMVLAGGGTAELRAAAIAGVLCQGSPAIPVLQTMVDGESGVDAQDLIARIRERER